MKKPLKDIEKKVNDLLHAELTTEDKAWDIIFEFYHHVLNRMEEQGITQADLARQLGKSRSAISQLLNKTPNISVKKMVEIADAVGADFALVPIEEMKRIRDVKVTEIVVYSMGNYKVKPEKSHGALILPFNRSKICECSDIDSRQKQYAN